MSPSLALSPGSGDVGANTPKAAMESAATESRRRRLLRLSPEKLRDMAELKSAQSSDPAPF